MSKQAAKAEVFTKVPRSYYLEKAQQLKLSSLDQILKAPVKRGWNRAFGVSIQSKSDIKRALEMNLREINEMCVSDGYEPVYAPVEEETIHIGTIG